MIAVVKKGKLTFERSRVNGGTNWGRAVLPGPTTPATRSEVAWAAGVYEGEGSVADISFVVGQKDRFILERLKKMFGGSISAERRSTGIYVWRIAGPWGRKFATQIYPWLSPWRQEQIVRSYDRTHHSS